MSERGGSEFLKEKYGLHKSPEVEEQAKRTEKRTGEKVPQTPEARIQNYLNRFTEIAERKDPDARERGVEAIKRWLYGTFVIKEKDVPDAYFEQQLRLAREQGHGDIALTDEAREQLTEVIIADQRSSLDTWVDYFASQDATYPDWLKYWATRSVVGMGEFDKKKHEFTKRSKGTTKPFPDLNREALAYVLDAIEKKYSGKKIDLEHLEEEDRASFEKLLAGENFAKLYAWAIEKCTPASKELLTNTTGEWVKYGRNADHMPLVRSLQGHSTGWCTAGESTAEAQLKGGDFYVYYSLDENGKPTVPRAAIRMQMGNIAEVRGIADEQNLDPFIGEVVGKKMKEFPDGAAYEKKAGDMKRLTAIERKANLGQQLTKEDLVFLYEIDAPIDGFGYDSDPRIKELRGKRDPKADAPIVFECASEQIAWSEDAITPETAAYVGPLFPGVFGLAQIEHLYTRFPEGKIRLIELEIGGKTTEQYEAELHSGGFDITDWAKEILEKMPTTSKKENVELARLTVADLGFKQSASFHDIVSRAKELGLEPAPADVGPALRLALPDQPMGDLVIVGMEPVTGSSGCPSVFSVGRSGGGRWLDAGGAGPGCGWDPGSAFVFRRRKHHTGT